MENTIKDNKFYKTTSEEELLEMLASEQWKSDDRIYSEIKKDLHLDAFLKATNNDLNMLFNYLYYSNHKFGLSDVFIVSFIKDNYDTNFERKEYIQQQADERNLSFDAMEVKQMYDYLIGLFHRSQMNGLVDIDSYDRQQLKKLLKLPDNYR